MRRCVVCQKEYQESTETQKYCDRFCKRAAYLKITREEYLEKRQEREKKSTENAREANVAGYDNCIIFRDDGCYNRQYLTREGTWTVDREAAARCLNSREADELAKKHGVVFYGGLTVSHQTCDVLHFRFPEQFDGWLAENGSEIDADDPSLSERFIQADLESALQGFKARNLLRRARNHKSDSGPQDAIRR